MYVQLSKKEADEVIQERLPNYEYDDGTTSIYIYKLTELTTLIRLTIPSIKKNDVIDLMVCSMNDNLKKAEKKMLEQIRFNEFYNEQDVLYQLEIEEIEKIIRDIEQKQQEEVFLKKLKEIKDIKKRTLNDDVLRCP